MSSTHKLEEILAQAEQLCVDRGLRLTETRNQVLRLLCASEKPLSAYDLLDQLSELNHNRPAPPTVYRALDFLLEQGLAHKLESLSAFVGCSHPQHPHASQFLICVDCGGVNEMENSRLNENVEVACAEHGFTPTHPVIELVGVCAQCSRKP